MKQGTFNQTLTAQLRFWCCKATPKRFQRATRARRIQSKAGALSTSRAWDAGNQQTCLMFNETYEAHLLFMPAHDRTMSTQALHRAYAKQACFVAFLCI